MRRALGLALGLVMLAAPAVAQTDDVVYEEGRLVVIEDAAWCQDILPGQDLRDARQRCVEALAAMADLASRGKRTLVPAGFVLALADATDAAAPRPTPTLRPALPATIPGSGTFLVGSDIAPGTYRSMGPVPDRLFCYSARLSGFSGELDDIISNDNSEGQVVVTIAPSDAAFETSGCQDWNWIG